MNIAFFCDGYAPSVDGAVTSMLAFNRELTSLGHKVFTIAPTYPNFVEKDPLNLRIPSIPSPFPPKYRITLPCLHMVIEFLQKQKIDIVHSHSPFTMGSLAMKGARKLGLPLIATYHTLYPTYVNCYFPYFKEFMSDLTKKHNKSYCNKCDITISPSPQMMDGLREYGVTSRIEVLATGIMLEQFQKHDGKSFRKKFGIPEDLKLLLFMGRLGREKNIDFLVRALPKILAKIPNAFLIVSGEGVAQSELETLVKELKLADKVKFMGFFKDKQDWVNCYAAADLFVFASLTETQGLVLLEAMAVGTPVVAVGALGVLDVMQGERGGFLSKDDVDEFSSKVVKMLTDKELYNKKKEEAVKRANEMSSHTSALKLENLYKELVQKYTKGK